MDNIKPLVNGKATVEPIITGHFRLDPVDVSCILEAVSRIPVQHENIADFISKMTEGYDHIYHIHVFLSEERIDVIPDSKVIYKNIKKVLSVVIAGSGHDVMMIEKMMGSCIDKGLSKFGLNRSQIKYISMNSVKPDAKEHGVDMFFLGSEKVNRGPYSSNISSLVHHFLKHPEDMRLLKELAEAEDDIDMTPPDNKVSAQLAPDLFIGKIIGNNKKAEKDESFFKHRQPQLMKPAQIFKELGKKVIGQDEAKRSLSVLLFEHMLRREAVSCGKQMPKTNALLIGPSGSGKTLIANTLADIAQVPFVKVDATAFVQRGYRGGMHGEQIIDLITAAAKGNPARARFGIVFIDEIDKLARMSAFDDGDLATTGVQSELLPIIDGTEYYYEDDHSDYERITFSFKNVLFIFSGAFERRYENIESPKDLIKYGFLPEFAGRMGTIIKTEKLPDEILLEITKKAVTQYGDYLELKPEEIDVYSELIHSMIKENKHFEKTGARCVYPAVRKFFEDRLFEL